MQYFDWVFIDLETTGLDPAKDKITEIAVISVTRDGRKEVLHSLVKPGIAIPPQITRLTGITEDMVEDAPPFEALRFPFLKLVQDKVIVAHNATFDLSFLRAALGAELNNPCLDTLELAKLLYPNQMSYGLKYILRSLSLEGEPSHRALADAQALEKLLEYLIGKACGLPVVALQELAGFFDGSGNGIALLFEEILREKIQKFSFSEEKNISRVYEKQAWGEKERPHMPWDPGELEKLFLPGGRIAASLGMYQKRPQQIKMLKAVAKALTQERHLLVEAGTGVGKSLAYLVPALAWACSRGEKVVVATHTIALQEQLLKSEIAFLKGHLGFPFQACVLKGRGNYLCLEKYETAKNHLATMSWPEKLTMARLGLWLLENGSGDRDSVQLRGREEELFARLSSNGETCHGAKCPFYSRCFYQKAKQKAQAADLIIVNHALLLSDLRLNTPVLPGYRYLIVDEAHHLEEEGTKQFSELFSIKDFLFDLTELQRKRDILGKSGSLHFWKQRFKKETTNPAGLLTVGEAEKYLAQANETAKEILDFVQKNLSWDSIRLYGETRQTKWWDYLNLLFDNLSVQTGGLLEKLRRLQDVLKEEREKEGLEQPMRQYAIMLAKLESGLHCLRAFRAGEDEGQVYWLEKDAFINNLRLITSPLHVGGILHDLLFTAKTSVVLTSATLSVEENFSFFVEQLGVPPELVDMLKISSPFMYEEQTRLLVDTSLPDPVKTSEEGYNLALQDSLWQVLQVTRGGTLVLFTSHKQMRAMFDILYDRLQSAGLELYADGINGRRHILLDELKSNRRAVVFGASTFWEGIDLPGSSLTAVIMVKLPFAPPNMPLVEARAEMLKKEGKDGFYHYSLPQAVLRFRQGYGRLIRTMNDWGVVVVLDNRLVLKRYGKMFIRSLPDQKVISGSTDLVVENIKQWFAQNSAEC